MKGLYTLIILSEVQLFKVKPAKSKYQMLALHI